MERHIPKIVFTGGPSGGKSTSLAIVRQKLEEFGFAMVSASETATDCMSDGITPALFGSDFQWHLARNIIARERMREETLAAASKQKKVLILDRSVQDIAAYTSEAEFRALEKNLGFDPNYFRDQWVDGVIFLRSPAVDKPEAYTRANNPMRTETVEQARELDERTLHVWNGSPHLAIIDNKTDMEGKALRVLQAVCRVLGIPEPLEIERKFKVGQFNMNDLPAHCQHIDIVQTYLKCNDPGFSERVRKRGQNGYWAYYHTFKKHVSSGVRTEVEHRITRAQYEFLLLRADLAYCPIKKTRICFVYENQYCELDLFKYEELTLLEIELTNEQDEIILPPFLGSVKDVTDDEYYSNLFIARRLANRSSCCH